jgi:hypothetical protein
MADEWRRYTYLGCPGHYAQFAIPTPTPPGVPASARLVNVGFGATEEKYPHGEGAQLLAAMRYWQIREGWRTLGPDEFAALYDRWLPKRDAILGKEEHLGKTRADWERFYAALADERAAREYAEGRVSLAFGLDGKELLRAMMAKKGPGIAG